MKFPLLFVCFTFLLFINLPAQSVWTDYHIDDVTDFNTLSVVDNSTVWLSTNHGKLYRTSNCGENWFGFSGGLDPFLGGAFVSGINGSTSMFFDHGYYTYPGGTIYTSKIYKSISNGNNNNISDLYVFSSGSTYMQFLKMTDSLNGYFIGPYNGRFQWFKTVNGGYNWSMSNSYLPNSGRNFSKSCLAEIGNNLWFTSTD